MNKRFLSGLLIGLLVFVSSARSEEFDIADLAEGFAAEECLDYCIVGVCFWLVGCPYCHIKTDAKIQHRLPDLVVTAFKKPGESPWKEGRNAYGSFASKSLKTILSPIADGSFTVMERGAEKSDRMFNEVHVVGNPVAYVSNAVDYLCPTKAMPIPYFLSEVDSLAWRDPRSEMTHIESYTPGMREIWGIGTSVYPRVGTVMQPDPPKAAATDAQRAIDIVLQNWQVPHVYIPFGFANFNPDLMNILSNPAEGGEGFDTLTSLTGTGNGLLGAGSSMMGNLRGVSDIASGNIGGISELWTFNADTFNSFIGEDYASVVKSGIDGVTQISGMTSINNLTDFNVSGYLANQITWLEPGIETEKAWQMISPKKQMNCESFVDAPGDWSDDKQSKEYTWGWQYWRKYKCCVPHAGAYVGSVEFEPICIIGSNDY